MTKRTGGEYGYLIVFAVAIIAVVVTLGVAFGQSGGHGESSGAGTQEDPFRIEGDYQSCYHENFLGEAVEEQCP